MGAFEGCFLKMEKRVRIIKAKPMLIAAEANRLCGFMIDDFHTHRDKETKRQRAL
jgi:hypothetical protein